jgi:hypothetical protein
MAAALIFEFLCAASLVFMICVLIALLRDGKRKSQCRVVHLMSRYPASEGAAVGGSEGPVFSRSNVDSGLRLKVIFGSRGHTSRKVG